VNELLLHPQFRSSAVQRIAVEAARRNGTLILNYRVTGAIANIRIPPKAASLRTDELWRHTCFEAFLRAPASPAYCELNFAPSTAWAAYRFDSYRAGIRPAEEIAMPQLTTHATADSYELHAAVDLTSHAELQGDWRLALTAVIEEMHGDKSYWALAHPAGKPDFHHDDGFILSLPFPSTGSG
jgi:hypothetical protein